MEHFIRDHNIIHKDDNEKFLEDEGRERFLTYLAPIINGTGTYSVEVKGKGFYSGDTQKLTFKINKAANPHAVKAKKTVTVQYKKLKKKAQTLAVTKAVSITGKSTGAKTYKLMSVTKKDFKKYFKVNSKTGKITIKKGLKKGTYKVKIKVIDAGDKNYLASDWKTVTFKVKVK